MTTQPQTYLPPRFRGTWSRAPVASQRALRHAAAAIPHVSGYLQRSGAAMVVIHFVTSTGRRMRQDVTVWRPDGGGYRVEPHASLDSSTVLADIAGALAELAREIGSRWPANAQPRAIGIAVDGHSIAFNASHPSADGCEWLDEHIRGRAPATLLHDGGKAGLLSRLCPGN